MNTRFVCEEHAPKPNAKFLKMKPEELVGKFVKICFDTRLTFRGRPMLEHMWVLTTGHDEKNDRYVGVLNNHPVLSGHLIAGDIVHFKNEDIEDLFVQN